MVFDLNTVRKINTTPQVEQPGGENLCMYMYDPLTPMNEQYDFTQFNPDTFLCDDEFTESLTFNGGSHAYVLGDLEITLMIDEHCNNHRPKKALKGTLSSDSDDAESISATSYQGISSPDSVHNLSRNFHKEVLSSSYVEDEIPSLRKDSCKDTENPTETSINRKTRKSHLTRRTIPSNQEVKEGKSESIDASMDKKSSSSLPMVNTEKKGWIIKEEAMDRRNRKNPRYIYLMNMVISFILLVAVIANITSVSLSVKA